MLGFPLLYFKGMRLMMFQLSSFYSTPISHRNERLNFPIPTKLEEPKKFKG